MDNERKALCHPNRKHYVKNLCKSCHEKIYRANRRQCEEYRKNIKIYNTNYKLNHLSSIEKSNTKWRLRKMFNLTIDEYDKMLEKQNGVCAICQKPEFSKVRNKPRKLAIDHCHLTNKIRGLLCMRCNTSLYIFDHYPHALSRLILYLTKNEMIHDNNLKDKE